MKSDLECGTQNDGILIVSERGRLIKLGQICLEQSMVKVRESGVLLVVERASVMDTCGLRTAYRRAYDVII